MLFEECIFLVEGKCNRFFKMYVTNATLATTNILAECVANTEDGIIKSQII